MLRAKLATPILLIMMCCGCVHAETKAKTTCESTTEASRNLVVSFYTQALVKKQVRAAFEQYVSPDFVEHKPDVPAGSRSVVVDFLEDLINRFQTLNGKSFVPWQRKILYSCMHGSPPHQARHLMQSRTCSA